MTGLRVQQTNRRMCRHVLVTLLFFCRPHDVFMQDRVPCEAGEVTVGQTARITCSFPPGTIVPKSSDFVVKKFHGSSRKEDILECSYPQGSTLNNPDCHIPNTSLGYTFTFVPNNDRQTVVIPSAKPSDAGVYGCERIGHRIDRCNLTVTPARVLCEAGEVTVGQRARITCIFHPGTITPNNGGDFVVKTFLGDSKEEDILECYYPQGSTSGTPNCVFQNKALGYDFTFVPENDRQTVVIPSVKLSDAGQYGCYRTGHRIGRCNLTVTGDAGGNCGPPFPNIWLIVPTVVVAAVMVVAVAVLLLRVCCVHKWWSASYYGNLKITSCSSVCNCCKGGYIPLPLQELLRVVRIAKDDYARKYQEVQQDLNPVLVQLCELSQEKKTQLERESQAYQMVEQLLHDIEIQLENKTITLQSETNPNLQSEACNPVKSEQQRVDRSAREDDKRNVQEAKRKLQVLVRGLLELKETQRRLDQESQACQRVKQLVYDKEKQLEKEINKRLQLLKKTNSEQFVPLEQWKNRKRPRVGRLAKVDAKRKKQQKADRDFEQEMLPLKENITTNYPCTTSKFE